MNLQDWLIKNSFEVNFRFKTMNNIICMSCNKVITKKRCVSYTQYNKTEYFHDDCWNEMNKHCDDMSCVCNGGKCCEDE